MDGSSRGSSRSKRIAASDATNAHTPDTERQPS